jgi:ABC-type transport system substrate-binding protein
MTSRSFIDPSARRSTRLLLASLLAVALAATGCSGNNDTPGASPSTQADMANRDPNAIYRFSWSQSPTTFDPDKITSGVLETFAYPVFDTLVELNPKGELVPMLAKSWEVQDNGKVLQLTLIENWKFHDGTAFNAAAVKAKIERSKTLEGSTNKQALASVTSVDTVGDYTVKRPGRAGARRSGHPCRHDDEPRQVQRPQPVGQTDRRLRDV